MREEEADLVDRRLTVLGVREPLGKRVEMRYEIPGRGRGRRGRERIGESEIGNRTGRDGRRA